MKDISENQILESISKWSSYLVESGEMNQEEVNELLGEGLVKRIGKAAKDAVKATAGFVGNSFKHVFGDIGKFMHDMVLANKGVAMLQKCIQKMKSSIKNIDTTRLIVLLDGKVYPIKNFDIPGKWSKALILIVDKSPSSNLKEAVTIRQLKDAIKDCKAKNLTSWVDGVVLGTPKGATLAEDTSKKKMADKDTGTAADFDPENLSVEGQSGGKYDLATNKLLRVVCSTDKNAIAFEFDVTEKTKKERKDDDDLLS